MSVVSPTAAEVYGVSPETRLPRSSHRLQTISGHLHMCEHQILPLRSPGALLTKAQKKESAQRQDVAKTTACPNYELA